MYSVPGNLIGQRVEARADSRLVRVFARGQLIKVHPRTRAGGRVTDPADLPAERTAYAGPAVGAYATAVLDHPLPWTKMRQAYALLGLVKRWGPDRVEAACRRALDADAIDVGLIGRMIDRATETASDEQPATPPATPSKPARFARDPEHFASNGKPRNVPATESHTTEGGVA